MHVHVHARLENSIYVSMVGNQALGSLCPYKVDKQETVTSFKTQTKEKKIKISQQESGGGRGGGSPSRRRRKFLQKEEEVPPEGGSPSREAPKGKASAGRPGPHHRGQRSSVVVVWGKKSATGGGGCRMRWGNGNLPPLAPLIGHRRGPMSLPVSWSSHN